MVERWRGNAPGYAGYACADSRGGRRACCPGTRTRGTGERKDDRHEHRDPEREQQPDHPDDHIRVDVFGREPVEEENEACLPGAVRLAVHGRDEEPDAPCPLEDDLREDRDGEDEPLPALRAFDALAVSPGHSVDGVGDHAVLVVFVVVENVAREPLRVVLSWRQAPDGKSRSYSE